VRDHIIIIIIIIIIIWLRAGGFGDRITVGVRFSAPVQTDPGAHLTSYTVGTGSLCRDVALVTHPHVAPKSRAIPVRPLSLHGLF
jgi:hypothetical protein